MLFCCRSSNNHHPWMFSQPTEKLERASVPAVETGLTYSPSVLRSLHAIDTWSSNGAYSVLLTSTRTRIEAVFWLRCCPLQLCIRRWGGANEHSSKMLRPGSRIQCNFCVFLHSLFRRSDWLFMATLPDCRASYVSGGGAKRTPLSA